jgi:hypothetical protein
MLVSEEEYIDALLVLEVGRDEVETTPDESEILKEAHSIIQEYRNEGEL